MGHDIITGLTATLIDNSDNRFNIKVTTEEVVQGSKTHDLDDVEVRQSHNDNENELREVIASGKKIARASYANQEAFREIGEIHDAIAKARNHQSADDDETTAGLDEEEEKLHALVGEAMEQTESAVALANDTGEAAMEAIAKARNHQSADDETTAGLDEEELQALVGEAMEQTESSVALANDAGEAAMEALDNSIEAKNEIEELREEMDKIQRRGGGGTIEVDTSSDDEASSEIEGLVHKKFRTLLEFLAMGMHVLLVGGAGTGKTHGAKQAAEAMDLDIEVFRGHKHAVADDLYGFVSTVDGKFIPGPAYRAVKHGKVLYVDEFDVCTPAFIKGANNLTDDSEYVQFPNGERVRKHEDFIFLASANTVGQGANETYTGASGQLDASSLDRLAFLEWGIDENIEEALAEAHAGDLGLQWASYVQSVREAIKETMAMPIEITPRATIDGAKMIAREFFDLTNAREAQITGKMTEEQIRQVHDTLCFEDEEYLPGYEDIAEEPGLQEEEEDEELPW